MKLIVSSLFRAIVTQFHPRMLWLAVWPFLVALLAWASVGFLFRGRALGGLHDVLFGLALTQWIEGTFKLFGLEGALVVVVPLLYCALLFAGAIVTALLIIGLVAMPSVVNHIAARDYPQLERLHGGSSLVSLLNALWATALFVVGWLCTMPLWLILPLAVIVPWFWWAWLTARILRYDALAQHATAQERQAFYREHRAGLLVIGLCVAALNFVPPLFFFAPIFGGIAFTHYALRCLEQMRALRQPAFPAGAAAVAGADSHEPLGASPHSAMPGPSAGTPI